MAYISSIVRRPCTLCIKTKVTPLTNRNTLISFRASRVPTLSCCQKNLIWAGLYLGSIGINRGYREKIIKLHSIQPININFVRKAVQIFAVNNIFYVSSLAIPCPRSVCGRNANPIFILSCRPINLLFRTNKTGRNKQEYQCNQSHNDIHTNSGSLVNICQMGGSDSEGFLATEIYFSTFNLSCSMGMTLSSFSSIIISILRIKVEALCST